MVLLQNTLYLPIVLLMYFYLCCLTLLFFMVIYLLTIMRTAIVPIIKNKTGAPVTRIIIDLLHLLLHHPSYLRSVFLKFWRLIMIINLDLNLNIPPTCAFLLLNACTYTGQNTPFSACLLDASEAFDRVNHWTIFAKLIDAHAPLLIVRVLLFWYQMQQVCIKWGKSCTNYFTICNGVRQGGIYPRNYLLYM